jgi:hypothetical protein
MKKLKNGFFVLLAIFLTLSMSGFGSINSITENEYLRAYFNAYQTYLLTDLGSPELTDSKNNVLDLIDYYLTTRAELSDFLWMNGPNSHRQIRTILDMNNAPCVCDVNSVCQATGDICCCHKVQGVCDVVQIARPKAWATSRNCATGCCGDYCCGEEPTTNCYSNYQCYITRGPCQACQKAGQNCVYEPNQCTVDADCGKYAANWKCNSGCCVKPAGTTTTSTTTTTLPGCKSDRECTITRGPCYTCPSFGGACTLQSNQCTADSDCTLVYGKAGGSVTCNAVTKCCNTPAVECATDTDCENIYGPHWACYATSYCTYNGININCLDNTKIGACNSGQQRCMDGPYGDAILSPDTTYC